MSSQRVAKLLVLALTTLFTFALESPSVCMVYTVVESAFAINACFPTNTVVSIESVTPVSITDAPTCITTIVTASTTLYSSNILGLNSPLPRRIHEDAKSLPEPNQATSPQAIIAAPQLINNETPSVLHCHVSAPGLPQPGTTPWCCQWYVVEAGDTCDSITKAFNLSSGTIYELNSDLLPDCSNLHDSVPYCLTGKQQGRTAP